MSRIICLTSLPAADYAFCKQIFMYLSMAINAIAFEITDGSCLGN